MSYNTCTDIEEKNEVYVFEVILTYDDSVIIKRIISMNKMGELFSAKNSIKKIKITLCILNSMETIVLKKQFNKDITDLIVLHKKSRQNNNIVIILNTMNMNNFNHIDSNIIDSNYIDSNMIKINYKINKFI